MSEEVVVKCDVCGEPTGANFFGNTAVIVCSKESCQETEESNWEDHCAELQRMREYEELHGY